MDISALIQLTQNKINFLSSRNKHLLSKVTKTNERIKPLSDLLNLPLSINEFNSLNQSNEELILKDLLFENKIYQTWRTHQKRKQELFNLNPNKKHLETFHEEMKSITQDDIVCVVCNDGDYEENDLIVYCSSCQLTVHQNCYGIQNLPEEDWICNICLVFPLEERNNVECCLCSVRGGAMKLSQLKKNSSFFKKISRLRGSSKVEFNDNEEEGNQVNAPEVLKSESNIFNLNKLESTEQSYSNKNKKITSQCLSNSELYNIYKQQILKKANDHVWVHVSCAIWNPNIIIEDFYNKEEIKSKSLNINI